MKPKALRAAVRERYPDASKKELARAAFYALTEASSADQETHSELHNFALAERMADDKAVEVHRAGKLKKKRPRDADGKSPMQ
ncbi:hypothetical protein MKK75_27990 [Methylobacterium sp. J-030]|uniref:hypothetical protein n=1 Tax=Methylobacterium sp. J-030 TaxID=2836627 RepID=UPI001FBA4A67|nr:hypothetical protein [Methylobacterium sp. J-030]MCJ2072585.1 hypothetical protein [Methylobacterium sp. J-030]